MQEFVELLADGSGQHNHIEVEADSRRQRDTGEFEQVGRLNGSSRIAGLSALKRPVAVAKRSVSMQRSQAPAAEGTKENRVVPI